MNDENMQHGILNCITTLVTSIFAVRTKLTPFGTQFHSNLKCYAYDFHELLEPCRIECLKIMYIRLEHEQFSNQHVC